MLSLTIEKLSTLAVDLACGRNFYNTILMEKSLKLSTKYITKLNLVLKAHMAFQTFSLAQQVLDKGKTFLQFFFWYFLNDLVLYISKEYSCLTTLTSSINTLLSDDTIDVYFKLYLLLYADDTVIFAESPEQLQLALYAMFRNCNIWKLSVNTSKTKIVIISRGKTWNFQF